MRLIAAAAMLVALPAASFTAAWAASDAAARAACPRVAGPAEIPGPASVRLGDATRKEKLSIAAYFGAMPPGSLSSKLVGARRLPAALVRPMPGRPIEREATGD